MEALGKKRENRIAPEKSRVRRRTMVTDDARTPGGSASEQARVQTTKRRERELVRVRDGVL